MNMNFWCIIAAAAGGIAIFRFVFFSAFLASLWMKWSRFLEECCYVYQIYRIPEYDENCQKNHLYEKVSIYLSSLASLEDSNFANLFSGKKPNDILLRLDPDQIVHDSFVGAKVSWRHEPKNAENRCRSFLLRVRKQDRRRILRSYLQHIQATADEAEQKRKEIRLYTNIENKSERWRSIPFTHPATLDTIFMDSELKDKVRFDLESFLKGKQYYHRLGRVWKRSYLLHGPGGTSKTSFVAAMAKHLHYDIYHVDLSLVKNDSDLKSLLLQTTSKSIVLVEDLDRFLVEKPLNAIISSVLNFTDGIISCCGEERLMIFTINSKESIDESVIRPGRLDVHIYFPLCDFSAFKTLVSSYLGVKDHKLFPQVEEVFQAGASVTAEEIGEILMVNRSSPSRALKFVLNALQANSAGRSRGSWRLEEEPTETVAVGCKEKMQSMREFRRLYGLLKQRGIGSRRGASFDLDKPA